MLYMAGARGTGAMRPRALAVGAFFALLVAPCARAQDLNDYPTAARAEYVFACMKANGESRGRPWSAARCSIDIIASVLPYERYVTAETVLSMSQTSAISVLSSAPPSRQEPPSTTCAERRRRRRCAASSLRLRAGRATRGDRPCRRCPWPRRGTSPRRSGGNRSGSSDPRRSRFHLPC